MANFLDEWLAYEPPAPAAKAPHTRAHIISVFNQKGGVGKTTSTISLAAALAELGRRVLVVDFDPQGSLTVGLTGNQEIEPTIYEALLGHVPATSILLKSRVAGVDLLPAGIDLSSAELQLVNEVGREFALQRVLDPLMEDYDYILIDCLPSLGLLAINALATSEGLIIPLQCEFYALKGIGLLEQTLEKVQARLNSKLKIVGLLPTMVGRSGHHRDVLQRVLERYGDEVFHTFIPETIKFSEATVAAQPITSYAASSPAAAGYRKAAVELLYRIEGAAAAGTPVTVVNSTVDSDFSDLSDNLTLEAANE